RAGVPAHRAGPIRRRTTFDAELAAFAKVSAAVKALHRLSTTMPAGSYHSGPCIRERRTRTCRARRGGGPSSIPGISKREREWVGPPVPAEAGLATAKTRPDQIEASGASRGTGHAGGESCRSWEEEGRGG